MKIVGCDLHTRYQQVAMLDAETGELVERRLEHENGEAQVGCRLGPGWSRPSGPADQLQLRWGLAPEVARVDSSQIQCRNLTELRALRERNSSSIRSPKLATRTILYCTRRNRWLIQFQTWRKCSGAIGDITNSAPSKRASFAVCWRGMTRVW